MTLRVRQLRLRVETEEGAFGADIPFEVGLNVLWADNTQGKSTCMQAMIYALGLEKMLSPKRQVPLAYVMTTHLDDPASGKRLEVLESTVFLELENHKGEIITIKRGVKSSLDRRLVSVFSGPLLTEPSGDYRQQDYFVLDAGAAQREAGLHKFLAGYIGWELPTVRRYDGAETMLYLETIFPLFYVEQKVGWSAIPAAFPSYFQIRDIGRRAVEFVLALRTHEVELRKQQLEIDLATSNAAWRAKREDLLNIAGSIHGRVEGLPNEPVVSAEDIKRIRLLTSDGSSWCPIADSASVLRKEIADLKNAALPVVASTQREAEAEVDRLMLSLSELNAKRAAIFRARQIEAGQKASVQKRLAALDEDLQKNLDAQKLRNLGSTVTETLAADHCPTCAQAITDTLLAQEVGSVIMPIEQNIEYIRAQRGIFLRISNQADVAIADGDRKLAAATAEVNDISSRIRSLRADLVSASGSPSIAAIEQRVRLESRLSVLEDAQQKFEQQRVALEALSKSHANILAARNALPRDRFSGKDRGKLSKMESLIREQIDSYGFQTFPSGELEISEENYRPQREGFEIGFEMSASDTIRLKWAYQIALLEVSRTSATNHAGMVIFDEPQQQKTAKISFKRLLERAMLAKAASQQVIFSSSEDRVELEGFLKGIDCHYVPFDSRIVRRLA